MKRLVFGMLGAIALTATAARADQVVTFEGLGLAANSFDNNAGASGQFDVDGNQFNNAYGTSGPYAFWSGWAISSMTNTTDPSFANQYSAITGSGAGGSQTYAVGFPGDAAADPFHPADSFINLATGTTPLSVDVTNTTYAYDAMLNGITAGDGSVFARKFGPGDYFRLDVRGYTGLEGQGALVGTVDFYLADFLGTNAYIVNTWQTIDLSSLAGARSLQFGLASSDNNSQFGMNTPGYFAIDNLDLGTGASAVPEPGGLALLALGALGAAGASWRARVRVSGRGRRGA